MPAEKTARKCHAAHRNMRRKHPAAAAKMLNARKMTRPPLPAAPPPSRARDRKWPAAPRTTRMAQRVAAQVVDVGSTTTVTIPHLAIKSHTTKAPAWQVGAFSRPLFSCNSRSKAAGCCPGTGEFPFPRCRAIAHAGRFSTRAAVLRAPAPLCGSDAPRRTWGRA